MSFDAHDRSLDLIRCLNGVLRRIRSRNRSLCNQLERALASIPLNLAEGRQRVGRDRLQLYRVAAGSAAETSSALQVAVAFGYCTREELEPALDLLDRVTAMLYRLTH